MTQSVAEAFDFDTGSLTLRGDRWGDPSTSSVPLVLLHGGGQTRHSWDRTARRMAGEGRSAITLDARGHGESEWAPDSGYPLDAFVADLIAFLRDEGRPVCLVGASLGGITSLWVAAEHPELVAGLVLVDVVLDVNPEGVYRIRDFMTAHPNGFGSLEEVADAIAAYNLHRPRPTNLGGLRRNVRLGPDGRWHWHWDPTFIQNADEPQRKYNPVRLRELAGRVKCPTLIVQGLRSDIVGDAGVEGMLTLIPQAQIARVADAGHMVAGDDNDVFTSALTAFLRSL